MKNLFLLVCFMLCGLFANVHSQESKKPVVVILLGAPGSGKGTQAVHLSKDLAIPHISTGDLFRENISKNTELGQKAKDYMSAGQLVPDETVLDMLFDRVSRPDAANGYLLDGFPRTIPQAEAFEKRLGTSVNLVVLNLDVSDAEIMKRIAGRLEKARGEGSVRVDDTPEVVQQRLKVYHDQTEPLVDFYKKKGQLKNIDGEKSPEEVYAQLKKNLG